MLDASKTEADAKLAELTQQHDEELAFSRHEAASTYTHLQVAEAELAISQAEADAKSKALVEIARSHSQALNLMEHCASHSVQHNHHLTPTPQMATTAEMAQLQNVAFDQIDMNRDGVIDRDEYRLASQAVRSNVSAVYTPNSRAAPEYTLQSAEQHARLRPVSGFAAPTRSGSTPHATANTTQQFGLVDLSHEQFSLQDEPYRRVRGGNTACMAISGGTDGQDTSLSNVSSDAVNLPCDSSCCQVLEACGLTHYGYLFEKVCV